MTGCAAAFAAATTFTSAALATADFPAAALAAASLSALEADTDSRRLKSVLA